MSPVKKNENLLIVESPAKAKTIKKFLGSSFNVMASAGHVRDIKGHGSGEKAFGVDLETFEPHYEIIEGKQSIVERLRKAASTSKTVYLASDPDREGEAIAWHIVNTLGLPAERVKRVTYTSVTKNAVIEGIEKSHEIDLNLVNAQQARRILDRIVGFTLSPFLWDKVAIQLSAGRVQSVALKLLCQREDLIEAFKREEFWTLTATLSAEKSKKNIEALLTSFSGAPFTKSHELAQSGEGAEKVLTLIKDEPFVVSDIKKVKTSSSPLAPFTTSTLQQAASTFLGIGAAQTMRIAQRLYEGVELAQGSVGLITYMRTDSKNIAPEPLKELRSFLQGHYPEQYTEKKARSFTSGKMAQEAHEAIRPTSVMRTPKEVQSYLKPQELKLYNLIWRRFVASQMTSAVSETTTYTISSGPGEWKAKGKVSVFDGFHAVWDFSSEDDHELPPLSVGEALTLEKPIDTKQNFTQPPRRYSEATLIKLLEQEGIGRPSTYAPIITTLKDRGYAEGNNKQLRATQLGRAVAKILEENFTDIMDTSFTAEMESKLDSVESGKISWKKLLKDFYSPFKNEVTKALAEAAPLKGTPWEGKERCPNCGKTLEVRYSKSGAFLGCSDYPNCKGRLPFPEDENDPVVKEKKAFAAAARCPICGASMEIKRSRFGEFLACSRYPECKGTISMPKPGAAPLPDIRGVICDVCGKPMVVKVGRRGPFLGCSSYPECTNTMAIDSKTGKPIPRPTLKESVACEKCGKPMALKSGPRGYFLACTGYPQCKNTKPWGK